MTVKKSITCLLLLGCNPVAPAPSSDAAKEAAAITTAEAGGPATRGDSGVRYGAISRQVNFIASTGMSIGVVDNQTSGQADVTFTNTAPGGGGATSVTGTSGVSCSPTTGAVSCSNTGVTSNVAGTGISVSGATGAVTIGNTGATSVTGTGFITCSPTTGAVSCTTTGVLGAGAGGTGVSSPSAHQIVVAQGGSAMSTISGGLINRPLLGQGSTTDPAFATYTIPVPGTAGNVETSDGTNWVSAAPLSGPSALGLNSGVAFGASGIKVTVGSASITVPSGATLIVWASFDVITTSTTDSDVTICLGIDSTSVCTISQTLSCSGAISGSTGHGAATLITRASLSAASHTINAIVSSTGSTGTGGATVLLLLGQ